MKFPSMNYKDWQALFPPIDEVEFAISELDEFDKDCVRRNDWSTLWFYYHYDLVQEFPNEEYIYFGPSLLGLAVRKELTNESSS